MPLRACYWHAMARLAPNKGRLKGTVSFPFDYWLLEELGQPEVDFAPQFLPKESGSRTYT